MGLLSLIAAGFKLSWALVTGRNAQADRLNTPAMQANAVAKNDAATADQAGGDVAGAIKTGNLDQLRKDAAE